MRVIFFLALCLPIVALGQSNDQKDVEKAVEILRLAMVDANTQSLEAISANELSYGHSSGTIEDKAAFIENIVSGKSDFVTITLTAQTIRIVGDIAIVRHTLAADTNNGGTAGKVSLYVLLIWQKQSGQWKLLARQAARINP